MENNQPSERPYFNDIEGLFSEFIEFYGGFIVEKLKENNTLEQNADFLFKSPAMVGELKTFCKDIFSEPEDIPRLEELSRNWIKKGLLTESEYIEHILLGKELPSLCIWDLIKKASKTVERAIQKANKQISQTKKTFSQHKAKGLVFLINDGNYFFSNEGFLAVISNIIGRKFKQAEFDVIIYLTINQATRKDDSELDYNLWVPIYREESSNPDELQKFINDLGKKFLTIFLPNKTGEELKDYQQISSAEDTIQELKKHSFIPKNVIFKNKG
ncbi:hypothetical protein [Sphingobacterium siyangense]